MTRRLLVIAATAGIALTLAGCTKPNPGASVSTGVGNAPHAEAVCWAAEADAVDATTCATDVLSAAIQGASLPKAQLVAGNTIGISVDPTVADAGWIPEINGQALTQAPLHTVYYRFQYPSLQAVPEQGLVLDIRAMAGQQTRGFWVFQLTPAA